MTQLLQTPAPVFHPRIKPRMKQEKDEIRSEEAQAEQSVPTPPPLEKRPKIHFRSLLFSHSNRLPLLDFNLSGDPSPKLLQ